MLSQTSLPVISGMLGMLLLLISCNSNPPSLNDEPPSLPPASSMEMNFSTFESQQRSSQAELQTVQNFSRALGTALIMKTVAELNLIIPKTLLAAANNTNAAELNNNEQWEWNYFKSADGNTYSVRLVASREGEDTVNWSCYVTNSDQGLNGELFFSGTTNADGSGGTWTYYNLQNPGSQEQVSQIEWSVSREGDVELKLEVTSERNNYKDDYIDYSFDDTLKTATYYDTSEEETTEIQLNVNTNVGYIISPGYNDGRQSCWNENFQDIGCGEL